MGSRADHRHIATEHIDELRQFVNGCTAQEVAEFGLSRVICGCLQFIRVRIDLHRAEFQAVELLARIACPFLTEKDRSRRRQFDADCGKTPYERIDAHQEN